MGFICKIGSDHIQVGDTITDSIELPGAIENLDTLVDEILVVET
jgi:hypothetical protein